jgi:uncharacterized damage-inducible protein DinB
MPMSEIGLLTRLLDESYERKAWQGPNLKGSLRGVSAAQAAWRPAVGRHNIWELVLHAAYWKYAVRRMLTGERRGAFVEKGSNWFARPVSATERAWKADRALLESEHHRLREAVAALAPTAVGRKLPGSKYRTDTLVYGVASHDVYHTGQIQTLKRLWQDRKKSR